MQLFGKNLSFGGGMDPEKMMRADLDYKFQDVQSRNEQIQTEFDGERLKIQKFKGELLKKVFDSLRDLGVDPNDPTSVSQFLQKLEQQDPDLVALFESALEGLTPEEPVETPQEKPQGLMSKFTNLQNTIMRKK